MRPLGVAPDFLRVKDSVAGSRKVDFYHFMKLMMDMTPKPPHGCLKKKKKNSHKLII